MKVTSLASGSSGNCYLVQHGAANILIDCGLSASTVERHLRERGVQASQLSAIFLTHDHGDHLKGAGTLSRKWSIPVVANEATLKAAQLKWEKIARMEEVRATQYGRPAAKVAEKAKYNLQVMPVGGVKSFEGLEVSSVPVSHDAADTVCYTFRAADRQAMILTDLGCATEPIFEPLYHSDLIVLEANHEIERLRQNPHYPSSLKYRIASDHGHLSNKQSAEILRQVLEQSGLEHTVWLAHLSEDNNDPTNAVKVIKTCLDNAGIRKFPLQVALRDKPSLSWDSAGAYYQAQMLFDF
ncbi:MAG TPA: MBL fold metallo-hydrolase [Chloroflexia bacterium]|nr:MBL fold metallo-hydrolase [Chloroflexia bacterium]